MTIDSSNIPFSLQAASGRPFLFFATAVPWHRKEKFGLTKVTIAV